MESFDILYAVIANKSNNEIEEFGDKNLLDFPSIITQYFGSNEHVCSTVEFLAGKELPQTVMQGRVCCILTELNEHTIGGFFIHNEDGVFVRRKLINNINKHLQEIITGHPVRRDKSVLD